MKHSLSILLICILCHPLFAREYHVSKNGDDRNSGSMEQHSLKDQIAADRYLSSKRAAQKKGFGLRFARFIPPGTN